MLLSSATRRHTQPRLLLPQHLLACTRIWPWCLFARVGVCMHVCVHVQGTSIGNLESVEMLFKFIRPLVEEGEDDDDMDEEVRGVERRLSSFNLGGMGSWQRRVNGSILCWRPCADRHSSWHGLCLRCMQV